VTKIATDPFHNIAIYYTSPYYLLRGQLYDPMHEHQVDEPDEGAVSPRT
jgi:hypothetical protein